MITSSGGGKQNWIFKSTALRQFFKRLRTKIFSEVEDHMQPSRKVLTAIVTSPIEESARYLALIIDSVAGIFMGFSIEAALHLVVQS